jgi:hypothetical protein
MRCLRSLLFASSLGAAFLGCSPVAHAERAASPAPSAPRIALAMSPAKVRAPYDVQILRETGETLPTYAHRDRFYVQGDAGERYVIRITNPTPRRVEAVVSVDGLDVVDGEPGDLRKRGYIIPPYGETRIEGFRTSESNVATFRFSSVGESYAGRKGKARNVGVIAVAIFEEERPRDQQQIIVGEALPPPPAPPPRPYTYDRRGAGVYDDHAEATPIMPGPSRSVAPAPKRAEAPASAASSSGAYGGAGGAIHRERAPRERPGLGTEFGEQRYSAATYTRFVRAADRPVAIAELRYNDAEGLIALGIPVAPHPDELELMTRETANPFPGDTRFARPPR